MICTESGQEPRIVLTDKISERGKTLDAGT